MSRSPTDEKSFREECLDEERPSNVALQRSDRAIFESGPPKARAKASLSRAGQPSRQAEKQVPTTAAISSIQALSSQQLAPPSQGGFVSGNSHEKPSSDWKALATEFHLGIVATGTTEALDGGSANDRGQLQEDSSPTSFVSLAAFQAHIAQKREGLQVGRARFAGLTTLEEYKALLRVRSDQDIHALRKKGKRPASADVASTTEAVGDPQRRYILRTGGWEVKECGLTGERHLVRPAQTPTAAESSDTPIDRQTASASSGAKCTEQVWVHEGNVELHLWRIHTQELNHAGMDKTWSVVQQQMYGCTQNLCRAYVVACRCAGKKAKSKRPRTADSAASSNRSDRLKTEKTTVLDASRTTGGEESAKPVGQGQPLCLAAHEILPPLSPLLIRQGAPSVPCIVMDQGTSDAGASRKRQ